MLVKIEKKKKKKKKKNIIDKVPLFGSGVHPRGLVLVCHSEYRVGDAQVVFSALV